MTGVLVVVTLPRFGVLTLCVAGMLGVLENNCPLTFDTSTWYWGNALLPTLFVLALMAWGCHISLAGRRLFSHEMLG